MSGEIEQMEAIVVLGVIYVVIVGVWVMSKVDFFLQNLYVKKAI